MPDPCDYCGVADCDFDEHAADCPNNDNLAQHADFYYGFIQALCWASGAMPITFNEPDECWVPSLNDNIKFSRKAFLRHFADFDDGPVMMLRPGTDEYGGTWSIFCTEHPEAQGPTEAEQQGFAFAAEWADRG